MALYPLQDVLGLGSEARLNLPGRPHGNWTWRYRQEMLTKRLAATLREMAIASGRWPEPGMKEADTAPKVLEYEEF
jgi:4-alpha-glucanotransferase